MLVKRPWTRLVVAVHLRAAALRDDRGDVPGWVMVTVMTAGLVVAIFGVFRGAIVDAVQNALDQVVSGTGR
ncbi:MAG TPA: hypothetical protein VGR21_01145 [Cryptosporangiaceae bacterium]|nr:hypothetical protein [Cryptosporangiaceae bacterium]